MIDKRMAIPAEALADVFDGATVMMGALPPGVSFHTCTESIA